MNRTLLLSQRSIFPPSLLSGSDDLLNAAWTALGGTSPIVGQRTVEDDSAGAAEGISQTVTVVSGRPYVGTFFVVFDGVTSRFPAFQLTDGTSDFKVHVNTSTGAIATESNTFSGTSAVAIVGGFIRVRMTVTPGATSLFVRIFGARGTVLGTSNNAAVGVVTMRYVSIWPG